MLQCGLFHQKPTQLASYGLDRNMQTRTNQNKTKSTSFPSANLDQILTQLRSKSNTITGPNKIPIKILIPLIHRGTGGYTAHHDTYARGK